jgi:hypothetical protein
MRRIFSDFFVQIPSGWGWLQGLKYGDFGNFSRILVCLNYEVKAIPDVKSAPESILKVSELYGHAFLRYSKCDAFATLLSVAFDFQHMKSSQIVSSASQEMFYG